MAARAYAHFAAGRNALGVAEPGIENTRLLGGQSIKQHFVLLLAGRHLSVKHFSLLADEIEKTMFVWLITGTPGKDYERKIVDAAHRLREVPDQEFEAFVAEVFVAERRALRREFERSLLTLRTGDLRTFRLRYLLAKITQHVDIQAYGPSESRNRLSDYTAGGNDIEHMLPTTGTTEAIEEFGAGATDPDIINSLGNLLLIERSINRVIGNGRYTDKAPAYSQSKFLLTKCQVSLEDKKVGVADQITKTIDTLRAWTSWSEDTVSDRQAWLAARACIVWDVPPAPVTPTP